MMPDLNMAWVFFAIAVAATVGLGYVGGQLRVISADKMILNVKVKNMSDEINRLNAALATASTKLDAAVARGQALEDELANAILPQDVEPAIAAAEALGEKADAVLPPKG